MKSARLTIALTALFLVALPFVLLLVAWTYERAIVLTYQRELEQLAEKLAKTDSADWRRIAQEERIWLRRVGPSGSFDSGTAEQGTVNSFLGAAVEGSLSLFSADTPFESLADIDLPLGTRKELKQALTGNTATAIRTSESGQTVVVSVAKALSGGDILLLERGNHRGVRQLLLARRQLAKLVLYQLVFVVVAVVLLSRWLVNPLEQLTGRALKYPGEAIAEPGLSQRADEIGQLTRAFASLTHSLEARREETVRLAADIAHELKNPLATIAAASEMIAHTSDPSKDKRAHVHEIISDAVHRLRTTTDALLSLVRLESLLENAPRDRIDYGPWLEALLDSYRSDPQHQAWRFELTVDGSLTANVAAEAWASMLRNLIDNARVQPSTTNTIHIRAYVLEGRLVTEVKDDGPGVSLGNREKIFDRFFTARPGGVPRGTGLGLAIVTAVAEAHDGKVDLLDPVGGEGATFRVSIPQVVPAATPLPHAIHG